MTSKRILFFLFFSFSIAFYSQHTIQDIVIEGLEKTKKHTIFKLLQTKIGSQLDSTTVGKDIVFIKRLPLVSNANFKVIFLDKDKCVVIVVIKENFTILPDINFWETIENRFSYRLGVYDYNFLGHNITLGGFYQNNGFDSYGINFNAPFLFSQKWGIAINHQNWKSEEPLFLNNETANYLYNNISFEVLGLFQLNLNNKFSFGINVFEENYQFLSGADLEIPKSLTLNKTLLKFVYQFNNINYNYQYLNGFKSQLYLQYVTTENDFQNEFLIAWNDFSFYKRIKAKGNWASRIRFGLASNDDSPFAPFALDNNINIRGVGFLVDRGTGVIVANTEYRHTIFDNKKFAVQTNAFFDAGTWRDPGGQLKDFFDVEKLRLYSGVGLRFISKKIYNATFRIDYGFRIRDGISNKTGGIVFGLGQYF
jgi:outer membrane protein assembly factor BamA